MASLWLSKSHSIKVIHQFTRISRAARGLDFVSATVFKFLGAFMLHKHAGPRLLYFVTVTVPM
jgi:hypothetical protein